MKILPSALTLIAFIVVFPTTMLAASCLTLSYGQQLTTSTDCTIGPLEFSNFQFSGDTEFFAGGIFINNADPQVEFEFLGNGQQNNRLLEFKVSGGAALYSPSGQQEAWEVQGYGEDSTERICAAQEPFAGNGVIGPTGSCLDGNGNDISLGFFSQNDTTGVAAKLDPPRSSFWIFMNINPSNGGDVQLFLLQTPEPGSIVMVGMGILGLGFLRRRIRLKSSLLSMWVFQSIS